MYTAKSMFGIGSLKWDGIISRKLIHFWFIVPGLKYAKMSFGMMLESLLWPMMWLPAMRALGRQ